MYRLPGAANRDDELLNEAQPYSPEVQPHIIPGLGPYPEAPVSSQKQLAIKADDIHAVVKNIVRGCEYWLAGGRIVESPYEIEVFLCGTFRQLYARQFGWRRKPIAAVAA